MRRVREVNSTPPAKVVAQEAHDVGHGYYRGAHQCVVRVTAVRIALQHSHAVAYWAGRSAVEQVLCAQVQDLGPGGHCSARSPTHFEPSREINGTLLRGEKYPPGPVIQRTSNPHLLS